jgi:hypothetical protein
MYSNKFPFGGYKIYVWEDIPESKQNSVLGYITDGVRQGIMEVEYMRPVSGELFIWEESSHITTEQYLDGVNAGYDIKIKSVMMFQYSDYIFRDSIRKVYDLRVNSTGLINGLCKQSMNVFYGKMNKQSLLSDYPNQDSPSYIATFVLYYAKRYLRNLVAKCGVMPYVVYVDAFMVHRDDFVGELSREIGGLKHNVSGKIVRLEVNGGKYKFWTKMENGELIEH